MSLKSINPTETKSWSKLKDHFNDIKETHISDYFISNVECVKKRENLAPKCLCCLTIYEIILKFKVMNFFFQN